VGINEVNCTGHLPNRSSPKFIININYEMQFQGRFFVLYEQTIS